jgi:hypothetical protein
MGILVKVSEINGSQLTVSRPKSIFCLAYYCITKGKLLEGNNPCNLPSGRNIVGCKQGQISDVGKYSVIVSNYLSPTSRKLEQPWVKVL